MWVKICANTSLEDALQAAELGADAVGFVFAPSPRRVTPAQVRAISNGLPEAVERVGVFAAGSLEQIADAAIEARLHTVQLHGGLDLALAADLAQRMGPRLRVIVTLHWTLDRDEESAAAVRGQLAAIAAAQSAGQRAGQSSFRVLLDAKVGTASGGTGKSFHWARARTVLATQPGLQVVAAGGLNPENVAEAIAMLQPWGVDVASGVEREPGRKDFAKLAAFIENARSAVSLDPGGHS